MKKDYQYINFLKSIAILMVCTYHFGIVFSSNDTELERLIKTFFYNLCVAGVPLFFMVNGALLFNKELNMKAHYIKILKMFFVFCIWRIITLFIIGYYTGLDFSTVGIRQLLNYILLANIENNPVQINHFWFIPTLIGIQLLFPILKKAFDADKNEPIYRNSSALLCIAISILFLIPNLFYVLVKQFGMLCHLDLNGLNRLLPFNLSSACMLMYFIMGGLIHQQKDKLKELPILKLLLCLLGGLILLTVRWKIIKDANQAPYDAIFNGTMTISGMMIAGSIFLLAIKIKALPSYSQKIFQTIARNTLFIYYAHWIIGYTLLELVIYPSLSVRGLFINLLKGVLLVISLSYLGVLLKKLPLIKHLIN